MNMKNTIKLTKKSDKDIYVQHLRLVLFGIATIGALGFGIQFIFSVFTVGR
jgi:protein transport protein SEC61 subunit gamma-like protein|tara:strand:- start:104 stop:256 length:153 start_codon:yes stop_codon:yes gene_type:complete